MMMTFFASFKGSSVSRYNLVLLDKYPALEFFSRRLSKASSEWKRRLLCHSRSTPEHMTSTVRSLNACKEHSRTVWIRLLLLDSLEQLQQKKENTELINADRKPSKNDNLKYNKWLRKRAKNTGKTILTRPVRQLRIQLSDWFTWTKKIKLYTKLDRKQ